MKIKSLKIIIATVLISLMCFTFPACNAKEDGGYSSGSYGYCDKEAVDSGDMDDVPTGNDNQQLSIPAGQLTAAEWSDIENYEYWMSLFSKGQNGDSNGIFYGYTNSVGWYLDTSNMITVEVLCGENAVAGATVSFYVGEDSTEYVATAVTNAKGLAYVYADIDSGGITVMSGQNTQNFDYNGEESITLTLTAAENKSEIIEIMFVIDTTGSMGDELNYLKAEIDDVISRVKTKTANAEVRLALMFYRDTDDEYVTRYFDFTTDIAAQRANLSKQSSQGGGDYPEAVHTALSEAVAKSWSTDSSTRLLIHVLDAPPHETESIKQNLKSTYLAAAAKGIRIIPIASSGVDKTTEYILRQSALITGGTYIFLTDDSGIGGGHLEASVGEHTVELLNSLLVRVIGDYYNGTDTAPIDWRQEVSDN